ncbi:DUF2972 domain-containing protein [Campylobacter jejuni]
MGGGILALFKKLYKIKKQHKKEQKIYQQTIQVFPQLKYPSLEACSDYEQALRYKFHLSYMLGEVLIKAYQTWYKGSGFKLTNDIKKAKKEFQIFKEILKEIKELNGEVLKAIKDDKQLFLKEFPRIKNILKIHQDYKAILDNIFHNFNYFIQNFNLIEEWLLSDDFNERYKKENHPYPSLLNPKKLNDETEDINYNNIPAELAWEMNLPLPDRYKFVWLFKCGSGSAALYTLFDFCGITSKAYPWTGKNSMYLSMYNYKNDCYPIQIAPCAKDSELFPENHKLLHLLDSKITLFFVMRDPISIIKSGINHIDLRNTIPSNFKRKFNIVDNFKDIFPVIKYPYYKNQEKPNLNYFDKIIEDCKKFYFTLGDILNLDNTNRDIVCINFNDLSKDRCYDTFKYLSSKFGFDINKINKTICSGRIGKESGQMCYLPIIINCSGQILKQYLNLKVESDINILITTYQLCTNIYAYENITNEFDNIIYDNIIILVLKDDFDVLFHDSRLFNFIKEKLNVFIELLNAYENNVIKNFVKEEQIIDYLKNNKKYINTLRELINKELTYIRINHPEYIKTWKYYQEFEQMCKELDGNI